MEIALFLSYVTRMRLNDQDAFNAVFLYFGPQLYHRLARLFPGQPVEVREDLVQEAFVEAFRQLPNTNYFAFGTPGQFFGYLQSVAFHKGCNLLRAGKPVVSLPNSWDGPGPNSVSPEEEIERRETIARVHDALAEVAADDREMVLSHYLDNQTYQAIADRFGCPVGTVQARIHRCCLRLRAVLANRSPVDTDR